MEQQPAPSTTSEATNPQQLDLTSEPGWNKPHPQETPEYQALEFDVEGGQHPHPQVAPEYRAMEFNVEPPSSEAPEASEMPDFSRPEERDWRRIDREAKEYFDYFEDPQDIVALRKDLSDYLAKVSQATQESLEGSVTDPKLIEEATKKAVEKARLIKITELAKGAFDYEDDSRKERKQVDRMRENVARLLEMPNEQYGQLMKDWEHHNMRELHSETLEEDKKYKVGKERKAAKDEIKRLDEKYGGVLVEISELGLNKETADQTIHEYAVAQMKLRNSKNELVDKEAVRDALRGEALAKIQAQLRQKYAAEGLDEAQIEAKIGESAQAVETWLSHITPNSELSPVQELQKFENQNNKKELWDAKRQKTSEYIGSMLLMGALRGALRREKPAEVKSEVDISEVFEHGIDHNGSRAQGGAEALSNPEKAASFRGKVMAQLEMARTLSRNENTLMKALIYYTAVEKSLGESFVNTWGAIPEEKKKQARKKIMLGMAATSTAIARLSAKAIAKAKTAATTGAAAGTIWAGNKLKR